MKRIIIEHYTCSMTDLESKINEFLFINENYEFETVVMRETTGIFPLYIVFYKQVK